MEYWNDVKKRRKSSYTQHERKLHCVSTMSPSFTSCPIFQYSLAQTLAQTGVYQLVAYSKHER